MNQYQPTNTEDSQQHRYQDEIDLGELVRTLWASKWTIVAVTVLCVIVALTYINAAPATYQGSLKLLPISKAEEAKYSAVNMGKFLPLTTVSFNSNGEMVEHVEHIRINRGTLLAEFSSIFATKQGLTQSLGEVGVLEQKADETAEEFQLRSQSTLNGIMIQPPIKDTKTGVTSEWEVSFETKSPTQFQVALEKAIQITNQSTAQNIEREIASRLAAYNLNKSVQLEDLQTSLDNAIQDQQIDQEQTIATLSESAAIARALGIQKNTLESQKFSLPNGGSVIANLTTKERDYLRGYEALEKEIELIKSRIKDRLYVQNYTEINAQIRAIEQDQTKKRLDAALNISPLRQPGFSAIAFSSDQINFSNQSKSSLILALSILLGGMLGIFIALIKNTLK